MYAKATFLSQRHQFLFMYKCINHNIIVCLIIFLILYENNRFLRQKKKNESTLKLRNYYLYSLI